MSELINELFSYLDYPYFINFKTYIFHILTSLKQLMTTVSHCWPETTVMALALSVHVQTWCKFQSSHAYQ